MVIKHGGASIVAVVICQTLCRLQMITKDVESIWFALSCVAMAKKGSSTRALKVHQSLGERWNIKASLLFETYFMFYISSCLQNLTLRYSFMLKVLRCGTPFKYTGPLVFFRKQNSFRYFVLQLGWAFSSSTARSHNI